MKVMYASVAAGMGLLILMVTGCASPSRAPLTETGEKTEIYVISNRGNPDEMTERQYRQRNEVGAWMETDLLRMLRRTGYEARLISTRGEFRPAPGRYLLTVSIDSYHAGSSAARAFVGYGAGAATLDNSYALYGTGEQPLLEWEDGVGTSQQWTRLPRALNQNTVRRVTEYLRAKP